MNYRDTAEYRQNIKTTKNFTKRLRLMMIQMLRLLHRRYFYNYMLPIMRWHIRLMIQRKDCICRLYSYVKGIDLRYNNSPCEHVTAILKDEPCGRQIARPLHQRRRQRSGRIEKSYLETANAHQARGGNGGRPPVPSTTLVSSQQQKV